MPSPTSPEILACTRRLLETANDITSLLVSDQTGYAERELRRRFLAQPEIAAAISDEGLRELRDEAARLSAGASARLRSVLAGDEIWIDLADGSDDVAESKDLRTIGPIWRFARAIDQPLEELARRFGLADDDRDPPGYAPPARFIEIGGTRKYLPGLVERLTREVVTLRHLRERASEQRAVEVNRSLAERWAAAAPDDD